MSTEDQVDAAIAKAGVTYTVTHRGDGSGQRDKWKHDKWEVKLERRAPDTAKLLATATFDYKTGIGLRSKPSSLMGAKPPRVNTLAWHDWQATRKPVKPRAASVLHCLILDASALQENFGDWCSNYGYSEDSMKAMAIYQECCKHGRELRAVLDRELYDEISTLLEDY